MLSGFVTELETLQKAPGKLDLIKAPASSWTRILTLFMMLHYYLLNTSHGCSAPLNGAVIQVPGVNFSLVEFHAKPSLPELEHYAHAKTTLFLYFYLRSHLGSLNYSNRFLAPCAEDQKPATAIHFTTTTSLLWCMCQLCGRQRCQVPGEGQGRGVPGHLWRACGPW